MGGGVKRCSSNLKPTGDGRFLNRNYSGYLVPTNADIPELDILFVGEFDAEASPLGVKGTGRIDSRFRGTRHRQRCLSRGPASGCVICRSLSRSCCDAGTCGEDLK